MSKYPSKNCALASCGKQFEPTSTKQKFCSDLCKVKAWQQKQKAENWEKELMKFFGNPEIKEAKKILFEKITEGQTIITHMSLEEGIRFIDPQSPEAQKLMFDMEILDMTEDQVKEKFPQLKLPKPSKVSVNNLTNNPSDANRSIDTTKEYFTDGIRGTTIEMSADRIFNANPKNLEELKKLCPKELTGLERSEWIRVERQKYGV